MLPLEDTVLAKEYSMETNQPILSLHQLKKTYNGKEVLKGVDLDVFPGQIIGYIGRNGAGKSTTVKIILGLEESDSGSVRLFGEEITSTSVEYKKRIGYVPELADLYDNLTGQEYLTFSGELYGMDPVEADAKAEKLMSLFGLSNVYHSRIASYSKGMKQKTLIIASLLHDPDILFLDEPINGLDANSVMIFKELLALLAAEGKTIFYSSHIMDVVEKISSRIILLHQGAVAADGSFEELKNQNLEGSLEEIFNQLTGFTEHKETASEIVSVVRGV